MTVAPLLTEVDQLWRARLPNGVRSVAWSPSGRLVAVDAAGFALVDRPEQRSAPIGPDPIAAAWLGGDRILIADAGLGVVSVGGGCAVDSFAAACLCGSGRTVVAGRGDELVVWTIDPVETAGPPTVDSRRVASRCGRVRAVSPLTSTLWAVVGDGGAAVVDVGLDVAELVVSIPGSLAVAAHSGAGFVAVGDLGGCVHLVRLHGDGGGVELDGYPDRVRHLGWVGGVDPHLVAVADDELTWWRASVARGVADEPTSAIGHAGPITAFAASAVSMVATGDAAGGLCIWSTHVPDRPVWSGDLGVSVTALAWSGDGGDLLAGAADGSVARYRVRPGSIA